MTYDELSTLIQRSDYNDWVREADENFTLKQDVAVRIQALSPQFDISVPWLDKAEWSKVVFRSYRIFYNSSLVMTFTLFNIEGELSRCPVPNRSEGTEIAWLEYRLASIVVPKEQLDNSIQRFNLSVQEAPSSTFRVIDTHNL